MILNNCFMVLCIVRDGNENHIKKIEDKLSRIVKERVVNAFFELSVERQYWKYPEDKEVIFKVKSKSDCYVSDFIKAFPLTWIYSEGPAFEEDLGESFLNEKAIWSKNTNPEEEFLISAISWAKIYTWPEDKI